ncbi:MAG TPA: AMP-binding protein [Acidimicrobiales bacterium]
MTGSRPEVAAAETLPALFAAGRPDDPDAVFLEIPGGEPWTYGATWDRAAQVANGMRAAGVRPGDRVAVQVEKSPEAILAYLACVRSGAVLLPLNTAYTDDEVGRLTADAAPALLLRDRSEVAAFAEGQPVELDDHPVGPDDQAALLYTSGTTGRPKGAMLTHRNLASNAAGLHGLWGFRPDDVLLHVLPVFHTHGLFVATNCVLANGTRMIFLPRFDPDLVFEHLGRTTVMMGVPTHYTRLLADPRLTTEACRSVRLFVCGSAPLLASVHRSFRDRTGKAILERYGMTETSMISSNPLDGERRPGTVGFPLPDVEVRLADVDAEGVGGVEVHGPNVFSGYRGRPDLDASEFRPDGFFRTGDLGTLDDDGYLRIVGRTKDLVISGGLNVHPTEVEEAINALDGVLESAVVGLPDTDLGEAVVAVVVARPGATLDPDRMRTALRAGLAGFKVPKRVVLLDELPRNAMGKVEKAILRTLLTS